MRNFTIYTSSNDTFIHAERPMTGEAKDRAIKSKLSIIPLVKKLSDRDHIFDVTFWLDGEKYSLSEVNKLHEDMAGFNGSPSASFSSQKDLVTLCKFAECQ